MLMLHRSGVCSSAVFTHVAAAVDHLVAYSGLLERVIAVRCYAPRERVGEFVWRATADDVSDAVAGCGGCSGHAFWSVALSSAWSLRVRRSARVAFAFRR